MENQYSYSFSSYFYLAIVLFLLPILVKYFFHRRRNLPPSPFSLPIIGHLYLLKKTLHLTLTSLSAKYGPVLYLKLGSMPVIVVSSPSAVEECLTKNDIIFANRPKTVAGDKFTYNYTVYVWAPYGQLWRILRRLTVVELFSSHSLQKTSILRDQEVAIFIRSLYKFSKDSSKKVDLTNWSFTLVFNLMTKIIAGRHIVKEEDAGKEKGIEIIEKLRGTFLVTTSFLNMCDFLPVFRWVGYKGLEKKMASIHNRRNEFLNSLLDEFRHKKSSASQSNTTVGNMEKKTTLIEKLLSLQESEPEFYTDDIIKSIMLVVFVAGTETSSTTIQWVMRLLVAHPEALYKLRADIDSKVGNKRLLNESDLNKLPYLHCVVNETMRLYTPIPLLLPHYSTKDCIVEGYDVPKHTMLFVNAWAIHRDPKVWEEPDKFKPERFEATEGETERFNYKLVPFGIGRRACPGADMGLRAVSLALGALIQCFDWQIEEAESLEESYNSRMTMQNKPLKAVCTPREDLGQLLSQL
ncbi:cytochrome P450 81C13-like [Nicotiana tomentosiformis]|uniref:cytochrome P450 81C13-like n=1 Tax=Nicotiana tomentosiformis TaxID=4098 RepID=UPI00051B87B4|nr:cytochrome P450 81C13-like [Nicotiana tomentosiformis]